MGSARVVRVEPIRLAGLRVLGMGVCDHHETGCSIVNAGGWPLPGVTILPARDAPLTFAAGPAGPWQLLLGVSRDADADVGSIDAIRVTYVAGGATFDVVEPWSLRIYAPGSMPIPSRASSVSVRQCHVIRSLREED